jgi:hypothetical protein
MGSIRVRSTVALWIDNEEVSSNIKFPVVNANTGEMVHEAYGATPEIAGQRAVRRPFGNRCGMPPFCLQFALFSLPSRAVTRLHSKPPS